MYLEIDGRTIRIGELLRNEGTLLDRIDVLPNTEAVLVVEIDGDKRKKRVILHNGINSASEQLCFSYPIDSDRAYAA